MSTTISSSDNTTTSMWSHLPSDILSTIANHLHPKIGILRLRSICSSWRSSLPPSSTSSSSSFPSSIPFPLKLPFPPPPPQQPSSDHCFLRHRTTYLLTDPNDDGFGFLIKVEDQRKNENNNTQNSVSLLHPILINEHIPKPKNPVNLLDYRISCVCESYVVAGCGFDELDVLFKKVVVGRNFFEKGDFVVLGLNFDGELLVWMFGDEGWKEIVAYGRKFDDIISFNGRFYATADKKGRLVMIDLRLVPVDLVPNLLYGNGSCTSLLESEGNLYLVDQDGDNERVRLEVFKLDEKGRFWDYELNLNGCVFFLGEDANFSLSRRDCKESVRNGIFYQDPLFDGFVQVFDTITNTGGGLVDCEDYVKLFRPPLSWFDDSAACYFR